jgi:shikimate kinase
MNVTDYRSLLHGVSLYLIGMMGSGKSTVGKVLATHLGYYFFDTDTLIEQAAGQSIATIFAQSGEAAFRQLETQVLAELSTYTQMAIATGGGIVLKPENWSYLHHGIVVWLDAPIEVLLSRLKHDEATAPGSRPLLQSETPSKRLSQLWNERHSLYAQADVHICIQAADPPEQIATTVLAETIKILRPEVQANLN